MINLTPKKINTPPYTPDFDMESSQPPSSQPTASQIEKKKKKALELDWIYLYSVDEDRCFYMMSRGEYKMTCTHNGIFWRCNVHSNLDDHKMELLYYRCTSINCIQNATDSCNYRNCVRRCIKDGLYYVFKV